MKEGCERSYDLASNKSVSTDEDDLPYTFKWLKSMYAGNDFELDTDEEAEIIFHNIYYSYQSLHEQTCSLEFVPIRSNISSIYVKRSDDANFSIIWNTSYWELFSKFCNFLTIMNNEDIKNIASTFGVTDANIFETLFSDIYLYLAEKHKRSDSILSNRCRENADKHKKKSTSIVVWNDKRADDIVFLGKMFAMHHEFEHILFELAGEAEYNAYNTEYFIALLKNYRDICDQEYSADEKIHDYTKNEYLERLDKLIMGNDSWEGVREELFCDWGAFAQMVNLQQIAYRLDPANAMCNAVVAAKIYNMFRTWLYIAEYYAEESSSYYEKCVPLEDSMRLIYNGFHKKADEIEFRQVLSHRLILFHLQCNYENASVFSEQEWRSIVEGANPYVENYQKYIVPMNRILEQECLNTNSK
ncbi:hypothetical protein [Butyrivibrio sp.]|uniref:hypothetical protein n=1 Tax=Butyrivibrio sp. TaxID=28121 RepID=UPI0025C27ABE|nr:hypothetical protein [Butyrivibrio sp.]MBQ9302755.1 hypothetical protein [Butyrivibrio sp.]